MNSEDIKEAIKLLKDRLNDRVVIDQCIKHYGDFEVLTITLRIGFSEAIFSTFHDLNVFIGLILGDSKDND